MVRSRASNWRGAPASGRKRPTISGDWGTLLGTMQCMRDLAPVVAVSPAVDPAPDCLRIDEGIAALRLDVQVSPLSPVAVASGPRNSTIAEAASPAKVA